MCVCVCSDAHTLSLQTLPHNKTGREFTEGLTPHDNVCAHNLCAVVLACTPGLCAVVLACTPGLCAVVLACTPGLWAVVLACTL